MNTIELLLSIVKSSLIPESAHAEIMIKPCNAIPENTIPWIFALEAARNAASDLCFDRQAHFEVETAPRQILFRVFFSIMFWMEQCSVDT